MRSVIVAGQGDAMSGKKVWFITGAGRGMGLDFAKAALAAADAIATAEQKIADMKAQIDSNRNISMSLAFD